MTFPLKQNVSMRIYAHNFLSVYMPRVFKGAKELLPKIQSLSKKQIHKSPYARVINGTQTHHYQLYLTPNKYYKEANEEFAKVIQALMQSMTTDDIKMVRNGKSQEQLKQDAIDSFEEVTNVAAEALNNDDLSSDPVFKRFTEICFARFFDLISLVEHKARICDLLLEALDDQNKYLNIAKAVSIDPTINRIPEIKSYIDQLPLDKQSQLSNRVGNELLKPMLSSKKNQISALPMLYIGLVDAIGFIDGDLKLSMKEHRAIADELGVLDELEDITYFDKLFRNYLKSKVKEST